MQATDSLLMMPDDGQKINISVVNPIEVKDTLTTHTVYTLKGADKDGPFETTKRYRDFDYVRVLLVSHWPGCFIPPLPPKKTVGKNQSSFVEYRRRGLNFFCSSLASLKHLWYSNEFQTFLRTIGDVEKNLKNIVNETSNEIILKYKQTLKNVVNIQMDTIIVGKVSEFEMYCRKILPIIENFKETVQGFLECKSINNEQNGMLFNYVLTEYEKSCLLVYVNHSNDQKLIVGSSKDEKLIALLAQLVKSFETFYRLLDEEFLQIQSFLESLKAREAIELKLKELKNNQNALMLEQQKLNAGKQSIFKSILKKNIDESKKQVNKNLTSVKEDIQNYGELTKLITIILGNYEIDRFKKNVLVEYYDITKKITKYEISLATCKEKLFKHILANKNIQ